MRVLSRVLSRLTLKIPTLPSGPHPDRRGRRLPPATTLKCSICNKHFRIRFSCSGPVKDSFITPDYRCINCDLEADCFRLGRTESEDPDYVSPAPGPVRESAPEPVHRAVALAKSRRLQLEAEGATAESRRLHLNTASATAERPAAPETPTSPTSPTSPASPMSPTVAQPDYRMRPRAFADFEQIYGGRDADVVSVWSSDWYSPGDSHINSPVEPDWPPIIPGVLTVRNPDPPSPIGGEGKGEKEMTLDTRVAQIKQEFVSPVSVKVMVL